MKIKQKMKRWEKYIIYADLIKEVVKKIIHMLGRDT